jgi:hypothetical protein
MLKTLRAATASLSLFTMAPVIAAPMLLAACSTSGNPLTQTVTVNLASAQAEAQSILTSFKIMAAGSAGSFSAATNAQVTAALAKLASAVAVFNALPSGTTTYAALAQEVLSAVGAVSALVPLPPATALAINEGLALVSALVAGLSVITVNSAPVSTGVGAVRVIPGPIAIPLS